MEQSSGRNTAVRQFETLLQCKGAIIEFLPRLPENLQAGECKMLLKSSLMVTHVHVLTMVYFSLCFSPDVKILFQLPCCFCLTENANWQNKVHGFIDVPVSGGGRHKDITAKIYANISLL